MASFDQIRQWRRRGWSMLITSWILMAASFILPAGQVGAASFVVGSVVFIAGGCLEYGWRFMNCPVCGKHVGSPWFLLPPSFRTQCIHCGAIEDGQKLPEEQRNG